MLWSLLVMLSGAKAGAANIVSPTEKYMVQHININNGLPHNFVDDIYKDSSGFLWVSLGGGGLARYDGFEFLRYSPASTSSPIAGNFVRNVAEDAFGRLWVATDNGLSIVDLNTIKPIAISQLDERLEAYASTPVSSVLRDAKGRIWLRSDAGIECLTFDDSGRISQANSLRYDVLSQYNSLIVRDLNQDGNVWAEIDGKISILTPSPEGGIDAKQLEISLPAESIVSDMLVLDRQVWIATDKGLVRHARDRDNDRLYTHNPSDPRSLSQDLVTCLAIAPEGYLLASTLNGVNTYYPSIDGFLHEMASEKAGKLNSNFVNCMLVDGGMIWVGTETGGINLYTIKKLPSTYERHQANDPRSLAPNPVNAIYEDKSGTLWVGVVEGGLNRQKPGESGFDHFTSQNSGIGHNSVSAIEQDGEGLLWIGTWGGGLDVIDPQVPAKNCLHMLDFGEFGQRPYIGALAWDGLNQGVWIGTSRGIFFYDKKKHQLLEPFEGAATMPRGCVGASIDKAGHLWIGTMLGLYDVDLTSRVGDRWSARMLDKKLDAPNSLLREKMSYVYCDSKGTLWVGSDVHGLYRRSVGDDGEEVFENIDSEQGLVQNVVMGIVEDKMGRIWISTNKGLSCYMPDEKRFVNFSKNQGLPSDQFYWNAAGATRSGRIYFGAVDGLLGFDPREIDDKDAEHKVVFTRLFVDNELATSDTYLPGVDISKCDKIELHERNRSFSIEFSALDYTKHPGKNYCYKLEGFDKDWITLSGGRNFVTYTNLSPGRYRLLVSYHTEGMHDDAIVSAIDIEVARYFYHTPWFMALMAMLAFAAFAAFYIWRRNSMIAKEIELEKAVDERTQEISKQKQMLEERTMRIQELTVDRLSFFTNLTHEFRTPITLIMGPVHRALRLCKDKSVAEQLNYVERNAKSLLTLVNQLMDFRKIESGKMEIVRNKSDFKEFLKEVCDAFIPSASERGISLTSHAHMDHAEICFDKENVRKLLTNLLSNAVKYTPDHGHIDVTAALLPQHCTGTETEQLYLCVSDTGDGIATDDINKVFDRFYQGKSYVKYPTMQASSGIGLHLCKCIVEAYGGHISVKNNPVRGCRFRIVLPVPTIDDEANAPILPSADAPVAGSQSGHRLRIMVIEDNEDMRGYIRSILSDKYSVVEASNGEEALKTLATVDVDFIICDLMMPVMDGMEFAKMAKENFATSHLPIIMLTARTAEEAKIASYNLGVDDYICKPFSEEVLLARIENIIANKERHQRRFAMDYNPAELQIEESRDKKFLDQVMEVLKENYKNSYFDMGDFSEALGVSRSVLNKKLQSIVGQSSNEFVRNYRLNIAHQMILDNRSTRALNISEIAYDVGFNDSKYFTRCFTKHFGITPSALMQGDKAKQK